MSIKISVKNSTGGIHFCDARPLTVAFRDSMTVQMNSRSSIRRMFGVDYETGGFQFSISRNQSSPDWFKSPLCAVCSFKRFSFEDTPAPGTSCLDDWSSILHPSRPLVNTADSADSISSSSHMATSNSKMVDVGGEGASHALTSNDSSIFVAEMLCIDDSRDGVWAGILYMKE